MTDKKIVLAVFHEVMQRDAEYSTFDDRLITQKIVYLLNAFGVTCGNYSFTWYKRGPYSQELQNEVMSPDEGDNETVQFSSKGTTALQMLKGMQEVPHEGYSDAYWMEALGSLHFLSQRIHRSSECDKVVIELERCKPHLNNHELNNKAFNLLSKSALLQ